MEVPTMPPRGRGSKPRKMMPQSLVESYSSQAMQRAERDNNAAEMSLGLRLGYYDWKLDRNRRDLEKKIERIRETSRTLQEHTGYSRLGVATKHSRILTDVPRLFLGGASHDNLKIAFDVMSSQRKIDSPVQLRKYHQTHFDWDFAKAKEMVQKLPNRHLTTPPDVDFQRYKLEGARNLRRKLNLNGLKLEPINKGQGNVR